MCLTLSRISSPVRYRISSVRLFAHITVTSSIKAASLAFALGTMNLLIPSSRPFLTTGSTPLTPVISPPSDSSPINNVFSTLFTLIMSIAIKILTATGRS